MAQQKLATAWTKVHQDTDHRAPGEINNSEVAQENTGKEGS